MIQRISHRSIGTLIIILVLTATAWPAPRHVFLTYSGAPETTLDINVIQTKRVTGVKVHYGIASGAGQPSNYANAVDAVYRQTTMELADARALYVAPLSGLTPGTTYYFIAGEPTLGYSPERKFRTLPGGDAPYRFINGGDMATGSNMPALLKLAAKEDPDLAVLGGDFAYENGALGYFGLWDAWINNWNTHMVTSDGRAVPVAAAIGNHECNAYATSDYALRAPWYLGIFGRQASTVYYSRAIGAHSVFFFLDSGHLNAINGAQTPWLAAEMAKYKDVPNKFAVYHVPMYPSYRDYNAADSAMERRSWLPLFDQYGLTLGMEHNDHEFKRTWPLRGGQVAEGGTVYIGDGCFGQTPRTLPQPERWYNQLALAREHFWVIDVTTRSVHLRAIDKSGAAIDDFTLTHTATAQARNTLALYE